MFVVEMAEEATETGDTVEEVKDEKVEEEMEREAEEAVPGIIRSIPPLKYPAPTKSSEANKLNTF